MANVAWLASAVCLACLALALFASPALAQGPTPPAVPAPPGRPSAARGKDLFATNCVPCHGTQGRGDGQTLAAQGQMAPSFANPAFHRAQSLSAVYNVISEGRIANLMPPWKNRLSPEQMWDVAYYAWWLGTGPRALARGQTIWQAECASCHGATGATLAQADLSRAASTIGQSQTEWITRFGQVPQHAPVLTKLAPTDQTAALAYARTLGFDTPPLPPTNGVIRGTVRNGTPGATIAPSAVISASLYTFVGEDENERLSTPVAPDGSFTFEGLVADPDYSYGVGTRYNGIDYFSQLIQLQPGATEQAATINVYETTTTDPGLSIARVHVIADFVDDKTLRVGELYEVQNSGQRAFVAAPGGSTFDLPIPPGATNVRFQDDSLDVSKVRSGDVLRIPSAWPPGSRRLIVSYDLPYTGNARVARTWPYPAANVDVLVADAGVQTQGTGLTAQPAVDAPGGGRYLSFVGQNIPAQQTVALTMSGAPNLAASSSNTQPAAPSASNVAVGVRVQSSYQSMLQWIGLFIILVGLVMVMLWPRLRPKMAATGRDSLGLQRERLLDRLADLDDAYAAGELAEADYAVQRADTKAQLVTVMRTLGAQE